MKFLSKLTVINIIMALTLYCPSAFAAEYTDTLRVGIYYGSATVKNLDLKSDDGFAFGIFKDREFIQISTTDCASVSVVPDITENVPSYHVDYASYSTAEEAKTAAEELKAIGIDAFTAYYKSQFHTMSGNYKNNNDALWAAENLAVKGTVATVSDTALRLVDGLGATLFVADDKTFGVTVYPKHYENADSLISISGSAKGTYRGGFECRELTDSAITVVNTVPVESYLYSVVCREMSPSWEVEALKAQAVCARNFALGRINYHKQYGFDVCRTVCCQAYSTSADQSQSVHTAVDETRGELLFYNNTLVQAVYSSSMGAYTESVENVWGTPFPYLVSVENPYEDTENVYNGKWTKSLTKARATEIMNSRGYNIGDVTSITVLQRTPAGGVLKLQVTGTNGSKIFERESCRTVFSEATYSQRYTVTLGGQAVYPTVYTYNGNKTSSVALSFVSVLGGNNTTTTLKGSCIAYDGNTKTSYTSTTTSGDSNTFVFSGEGWGHGVGMSQYGAKGMAMAGFDYEEILTHYYTGTHIEKAY
ncbi:MAG: SpoIID/LytB domain-containing protein [Clostridia bacterium]|nr:SpoIID/LytB domain-containing protein [Clostridia bacterium]